MSPLSWCIMGDFNDLMHASDKKDLSGGKFIWEKSRGYEAWVPERLDMTFGSVSWWSKFLLCQLKVIHVVSSDHDPIFLDLLKVDVSRKNFRFQFENIWLKEPGFVAEVKEVWSNISPVHLIPKLMEVTAYMAKWGQVFFHKFKEKIKEQKSILDILMNMTDEASIKEYLTVKENLNNLFYQEEAYWKQRAKLFWSTEGDGKTRFFHSSASSRKKSNHHYTKNNVM
ncbi:uncharacterized protein LOC141697459 [Apium graveolens]|uniref:uncharacterized protein LOC141697459 n=1 Tax=Apium graveolens TaxID=4045 RepID=UPI003D795342